MAASGISTNCWSDPLPELLGHVIALLPFPADRARFRAVCRAWHSAARQHIGHQLPWIVLPDCSFCTIGDDGTYYDRLPGGIPDNSTCLGAAADNWLALDCTDNVSRRIHILNAKLYSEEDWLSKHNHSYFLHNPFFSGETVPLPELESLDVVPETFEISKVLMRSNSPDDVVAVTTNNYFCSLILCRPGKGSCVVPYVGVIDVAFFGDKLYGITLEADLLSFDLADGDDGRPVFLGYKRIIKHPSADGEEDTFVDEYYYHAEDNDGIIVDEDDDDLSSGNENEQEVPPDEEEEQGDTSSFDGILLDGKVIVWDEEESPCKMKSMILTTQHLVKSSCDGQLLLVKHQFQMPCSAKYKSYTRKVEIFRADISNGKWIPASADGLAQGEALFLSRSFCKTASGYGDMEEGLVYFVHIDDVFDTRSQTRRRFSLPPQNGLVRDDLLTWLFPPSIVV